MKATGESLTKSVCKSSKKGKVFEWNKFIRPFRDEAIFWYRLWKEANSPNDGIIHDIRKHTRSRYHELKKLKKKQDVLKRNELTNSILANKTNDFWQCVRKN